MFERRCADPSVREAGKDASGTLSHRSPNQAREKNRNVTLTRAPTVRGPRCRAGVKLASVKYSKGSWLGPETGGGGGAPEL